MRPMSYFYARQDSFTNNLVWPNKVWASFAWVVHVCIWGPCLISMRDKTFLQTSLLRDRIWWVVFLWVVHEQLIHIIFAKKFFLVNISYFLWMSHVSSDSESCLVWLSMPRMNEWCFVWMSHVLCEWVMSRVDESCLVWLWVMSRMDKLCLVWMSHGAMVMFFV